MNYSKAIFLISDSVRAIRVSYHDPKSPETRVTLKSDLPNERTFKTFDATIKKGDYVVIPTQTRHKMTVCRVEEVDVDPELEAPGEMEWIITRVEKSSYEDILAQEAEAIAKIRRADERRKRKELRAALLADAAEEMKSLPIYDVKENGK